MKYKKICSYNKCRKAYESDARNQRYCCPECAIKANVQRNKRRKEYKANADYESLINKAYRLSMEVAEKYVPKPDIEEGEVLELHHRDGNVFNCAPTNLVWVTKKKHSAIHSKLPRINMVHYLQILEIKPELMRVSQEEYIELFETDAYKEITSHPMEVVSKFKVVYKEK